MFVMLVAKIPYIHVQLISCGQHLSRTEILDVFVLVISDLFQKRRTLTIWAFVREYCYYYSGRNLKMLSTSRHNCNKHTST